MSPFADDKPKDDGDPEREKVQKDKKAVNVTFSPTSTLYPYHKETDAVDDQWYSNSDLVRFQEDRARDLRAYRVAVARSRKLDDSEQCIIGLEDWLTDKSTALSMHRKRQFLSIVLVLQYELWKQEGASDLERIASACANCYENKESLSEARRRGAVLYDDVYGVKSQPKQTTKRGHGHRRHSAPEGIFKSEGKNLAEKLGLGAHFRFRFW